MDEVHVHRLRLLAGREGPPPGLAARVEDALRTSTKPPALVHRRIWIRRLRLKAPRGASAQTLALLFEREWAAVAAAAEPLASAEPAAAAVWAVDEGEARLWLLQRWGTGLRAGAAAAEGGAREPWFCARLAPQASRRSSAAERVAALLFEPWDEGPPARVRAWRGRAWAALVERGIAPAVWAVCDAAQRDALAAVAGLQQVAASADARAAPGAETRPRAAAQATGETRVRLTEPPAAPHAVPPAPATDAAVPEAAGPAGAVRARPQGPRRAVTTAAAPARPAAPAVFERAAARPASAPAMPLHSDWAGLALLLPVLLRAGYGGDAGPRDAALCVALLARAAQRHRADTAAQAWLAPWSAWHDAPVAPDALAAWWRRLRLATLREARLPLCRLIRRPGEIWSSPHRLDVVYPLRSADLRIRRAGFDLDPGYLPWLDAVIRFHYA